MRLLQRQDDGTLSLISVSDSDLPKYAILSHTWGEEADEVTYQDLERDRTERLSGYAGPASFASRIGYRKIEFCLTQAARDGLSYVWIDTCCINKDSQSELNKSLNWMFRWYAAADKCYVYLSDVTTHKRHVAEQDEDNTRWRYDFHQSRWFTRGWTLQELLAPSTVEFFSRDGVSLGTRTKLLAEVAAATGISPKAFRSCDIRDFDLQTRFNWGANRVTKEPEDRIYSLFGILDVSFPSNYGEGEQTALRRLRAALLDKFAGDLLVLDFRQNRQDPNRVRSIVSVKSITERDIVRDAKWMVDLLELLRFDQQDLRKARIRTQTTKTCEWLLEHPVYQKWQQRADIDTHAGLLWIKGRPGAGKSTLMKFANTRTAQDKSESDVVVSFYFNARGARLEKSIEGMYRSLLIQLISAIDADVLFTLEKALRPYPIPLDKSEWTIDTLQMYFSTMVNSVHRRRVTIFIDALDECADDEVREMLYHLEDVARAAIDNDRQLLICFASRYYPAVCLPFALELRLDDEKGHADDLKKHLLKTLRLGNDSRAQAIRAKVLNRANGIFIWAVLVIKLLNIDYKQGRVLDMPERLDNLPRDMSELFRTMVSRDDVLIHELVLCTQWVLFTPLPMTDRDFYYVMMASNGLDHWGALEKSEQVTTADIQRYLSNTSKGLVEVTQGQTSIVQFVHETVRDLLLKGGGLDKLWPHEGDLRSSSHVQLRKTCNRCLDGKLKQYSDTAARSLHSLESATNVSTCNTRMAEYRKYAASSVIYHVKQVAQIISQADFLSVWLPVLTQAARDRRGSRNSVS